MSVIPGVDKSIFSGYVKIYAYFRRHPTVKKIVGIALIILAATLFIAALSTPWMSLAAGAGLWLAILRANRLALSGPIHIKPANCEWGKFDYEINRPTLYLDTTDPFIMGKAQGYLLGKYIQSVRDQSNSPPPSQVSSPSIDTALLEDQWMEIKGIVEGYNRWASENSASHFKPLTIDELVFLLKSREFSNQSVSLCIKFTKPPIELQVKSKLGPIVKTAMVAGLILAGIINPILTTTMVGGAYISKVITYQMLWETYYEHKHFDHLPRLPKPQELRQIFENKIKTHRCYDFFKFVVEKTTDEEFCQWFIDQMAEGTCHGTTMALLKRGMEDPDVFKIDPIKMDEIVMYQFIHTMGCLIENKNIDRAKKLESICNQSPELQKRLAELNLLKDQLTAEAFKQKMIEERVDWCLCSNETQAQEYKKELDVWSKWDDVIKNEVDDIRPAKKESALFIPKDAEDFRKVFSQLGIAKEMQIYGRVLGYIALLGHTFAFECTPTKYRIYDIMPPANSFGMRNGLYEFNTEDEFFNALIRHTVKVQFLGMKTKSQEVKIGFSPVRPVTPPGLETPLVKALFP